MQGTSGGDPSVKNGVGDARASLVAAAAEAAALYDDPMSKVLGLDAKTSGWGAWFGFTSGSTLLLVGMMALVSVIAWIHTAQARLEGPVEEIDVTKEEPPPPPPPPTAEPEVKPEPVAPPHHVREVAPPPAPAQAAKVLTQEPNPDEPVDLTGNTIIQGNAENYAGGFTSADGKSANAVHIMAAPTGVPGGTGAVRAPPVAGPDRSRRASVGETQWNCPFPPEADVAQIDEAYVMLQVDVSADGTPSAVRVLTDPGNGFGREARPCALRKRFSPALDHDGTPIPSTIKVRVSFTR
jgi:protein TonB